MTDFYTSASKDFNDLAAAEALVVKAAYADMMDSMLKMETELITTVDALTKTLDTTDEGTIDKTKLNLERVNKTLNETQTIIDSTMKAAPQEWSEDWLPSGYYLGRQQLNISLEAAQIMGYNVQPLILAQQAIEIDPSLAYPVKASAYRVEDAYTEIGEDTQKWLADELTRAYNMGLPIGTFADLGSEKQETLLNNLLKEDSRLRGYTTESGRHVSAEMHAQAIARIEMTKISNDVAENEADQLGLTHCYNANPNDLNTTLVCQRASEAGVLPKEEMIAKHGKPPRLSKQYHLCRSMLIYVMPEWVGEGEFEYIPSSTDKDISGKNISLDSYMKNNPSIQKSLNNYTADYFDFMKMIDSGWSNNQIKNEIARLNTAGDSTLSDQYRWLQEAGQDLDSLRTDVSNVNTMMNNTESYSGDLYRGLHFDNENDYNNFVNEYSEGSTIQTTSMTSTSKSKDVAMEFLKVDENDILLVFKNNSGTDVSEQSQYKYQEEVIIPKDEQYNVISIQPAEYQVGRTKFTQPYTIITVEAAK